MIRTVAELLEAFLQKEVAQLSALHICHSPTIGAVYEGLTRTILDLALPTNPALSVASGFSRHGTGALSQELDCMLVLGDGESIPHTTKKIYSIDQVLAVVEVKKSLHTRDITEGHDNLRSVVKPGNDPSVSRRIVESAFQHIACRPCPAREELDRIPASYRMLYHLLVVEAVTPLRILLGYHGFKDEVSLRRGLQRHLKTTVGRRGFGPMSFPNVIMNRAAAAIKTTGMPWPGRMRDQWWPILATSSRYSPSVVFLEAIWTRLLQRGLVNSGIFGEDLECDVWHRLLDARFDETQNGWEYRLSAASLPETSENESHVAWSPAFLTEQQFTLVNLMCMDGDVDLDVIADGPDDRAALEDDIRALEDACLAGRDFIHPNICRLLTSQCQPGILPDGRFFAGENVSGRVARWTLKQLEDHTRLRNEG